MFSFRSLASALALFGGIALTAGHAQASILGDTVTAQYLFPNTSSVWDGPAVSTVVAPGGSTLTVNYGGISADFTGDQITIQEVSSCGPGCVHSYGSWLGTPITFNGPELSDLSHPFTSVSVDNPTAPNAFTPGSYTVSLVDGSIFVSWPGRFYDLSQKLVLDVSTAPTQSISQVPLPGALPMFGAALLGLAGLTKRRSLKV